MQQTPLKLSTSQYVIGIPANIFSQARYKFSLDKSYKRIWAIPDFQKTI